MHASKNIEWWKRYQYKIHSVSPAGLRWLHMLFPGHMAENYLGSPPPQDSSAYLEAEFLDSKFRNVQYLKFQCPRIKTQTAYCSGHHSGVTLNFDPVENWPRGHFNVENWL